MSRKSDSQNQQKRKPDQTTWWIAGIFVLLSLTFCFNVWTTKTRIYENTLVDPKHYSTDTVRNPMKEPWITIEGEHYHCNDCHGQLLPSQIHKSFFSAHENIELKHGANKSCLTCHSRKDKSFLIDIEGNAVDFSQSENNCRTCHGTKYRDWLHGAHGKLMGHWNKAQDWYKPTCTACHDPHAPTFADMDPAPGPSRQRTQDEAHHE